MLSICSLVPSVVHAHILPGQANGFSSGLQHPLSGLDHILAMVAVGLWAAQLGGHARWLVPTSFVSLMAVGGALGIAGVHMPYVETGILLSVFVLGVLIVAAVRLPLTVSMLVVGLFALFHGHSHGNEMPLTASGFSYGAGFILATALLHAGGIGLGMAIQKLGNVQTVRFAGAAVVLGGVYLCL